MRWIERWRGLEGWRWWIGIVTFKNEFIISVGLVEGFLYYGSVAGKVFFPISLSLKATYANIVPLIIFSVWLFRKVRSQNFSSSNIF